MKYYEWSEQGMEEAGMWGTYVHSDNYDALKDEYKDLQKRYDTLVNKIGELYQMA